MKAAATVVAESRNGRTVLTDLRSEAPIALRETGSSGGEQRVSMLGSAAGPVGGDELAMSVHVGSGASLWVEAVAATMVFPAPSGVASTQHLAITVEAGGRLRWSGQPLLVIADGNHVQHTTISLVGDAELDFVDEVALGRTGELPGVLDTHLRVERDGRPLLDQRQVYDSRDPAWATTAGVGGFRHVRHRLVVGCEPGSIAVDADPAFVTARFAIADDAELAVTLGVDRCSGAD